MASPAVKPPLTPISHLGLTKPGVVVIQSLFIGLFTVLELILRHGVGAFTGIAICGAVFATIRFARKGTAYVAAATAPLAFALVAIVTIILQDGPHPSRVGVDFIAALASVAPYLLISAVYGWLNYFKSGRQRPTK
ncbi:MAG: hypothetical protein Q8L08_00470 [Candidatus Nanopelagicaceae bacterium]|nr:hypothetical protein [Candidatus Nanopelagicaceae bacterium]